MVLDIRVDREVDDRLSLEISEETGQTREILGMLYDLARVRVAQGKRLWRSSYWPS